MSKALAFPFVISADGSCARTDLGDSVARLIGVMAATEAEFWPHAPWFGLRQVFESVQHGVRDVPAADDAITEALKQLGVTGVTVRVEQVEGVYGTREFAIHVREDGETTQVRRIQA